MSGAATTAQWLTCAGIGTGGGVVVLGLLKVALDVSCDRPFPEPPTAQPPALSASAPAVPAPVHQPRHARPPRVDETQPITCVQPIRARHSKGPAWT